jgi:L-lactate dehydrogenase (cytochrome)
MLVPASIDDYRLLARQRLPRGFFDYLDGGSYEEITLAANRADLIALKLRQRVLRDVSRTNTRTRLLGQEIAMPIVLAPLGLAGLMARRGEVQAARAAAAAEVPFCLSTVSVCSIEELQQAGTPFWFQLYVIRDRGYARELLQRAAKAGCDTLVFTVDLPRLGMRYRDIRNGLTSALPPGKTVRKLVSLLSRPAWLQDVVLRGKPLVFGNLSDAVPGARRLEDFKAWVDAQFDPAVTWQDLGWVREHWPRKIVIKGILDPEDARAAAAVGADAVVVSNHGGRQLDGAPSSISVLPEVVDAVGDRLEVIMDGGIRTGQDIAKALALGARACMIGRPWGYGLAARGERGVAEVLEILRAELELTLSLLGVQDVSELDGEVLYKPQSRQPLPRAAAAFPPG